MINGHGGNIYDAAKRLGCAPSDIIDMSSNVNPLGPPPGLLDFLKEKIQDIMALPEADAKTISAAFANTYDIDPRLLLAGNGTTQFIYTLPLGLKAGKVMILGPTYADYADACIMHHVPYVCVTTSADSDFKADIQDIGKHLQDVDMCFICNPNNPTGSWIPGEELRWLCKQYPSVIFVIDESYLPFVKQGQKESLIQHRLPNVIVLNSMSKIFRIPGLRIGFLISSEKIIERMARYAFPWNMNALAQSAVYYLSKQQTEMDQFVQETQNILDIERTFVSEKLRNISGIRVFPSKTSFILIRLPDGYVADKVCEYLLQDRILIRNCANFKGLSEQFIRISLKMRDANLLLTERLLSFFG